MSLSRRSVQICRGGDTVSRQQSRSSSAVSDGELARKMQELDWIQEQIAHKRANIANKKKTLQRTPYSERDEYKEEDKEWTTKREVEIVRVPARFTNSPQRPSRPEPGGLCLSERQMSILNELIHPLAPTCTTANPASSSFAKGVVEKRNTEILHRDLETKQRQHQSECTLSSPAYKSRDEQTDVRSVEIHSTRQPANSYNHLLGTLTQCVNAGMLSDMMTKAGDLKRKPSASINIERCRIEDLEDEDSRERSQDTRGEERGLKTKTKTKDSDDGYSHSRGKDRQSRDDHRDFKGSVSRSQRSSSRDRDRHSDRCKSTRDSKEKSRCHYSRERDGGRESREQDQDWHSRARDRGRDARERERGDLRERDRVRYSRERDRDTDYRDRHRESEARQSNRSRDLRETDRDLRHRRLESRDRYRKSADRGSKSQSGDRDRDWRNRHQSLKNKDRDSKGHRRDSWSPRRRYSKDRSRRRSRSRSRSSSSVSSSSDDKWTTEKREQFERIKTLLKVAGLDHLSSRTQERLCGKKRSRDSSWSDSSDDYRRDSKGRRRRHSCERRRYRDAERSRRDSQTDLMQTSAQLPPANYANYTDMYQNWYSGMYHSSHVQSWTAVGWSGAPGTPGPVAPYGKYGNSLPSLLTISPSLVTGSYNAPCQPSPHQYTPPSGPLTSRPKRLPPLLPTPRHPPIWPPKTRVKTLYPQRIHNLMNKIKSIETEVTGASKKLKTLKRKMEIKSMKNKTSATPTTAEDAATSDAATETPTAAVTATPADSAATGAAPKKKTIYKRGKKKGLLNRKNKTSVPPTTADDAAAATPAIPTADSAVTVASSLAAAVTDTPTAAPAATPALDSDVTAAPTADSAATEKSSADSAVTETTTAAATATPTSDSAATEKSSADSAATETSTADSAVTDTTIAAATAAPTSDSAATEKSSADSAAPETSTADSAATETTAAAATATPTSDSAVTAASTAPVTETPTTDSAATETTTAAATATPTSDSAVNAASTAPVTETPTTDSAVTKTSSADFAVTATSTADSAPVTVAAASTATTSATHMPTSPTATSSASTTTSSGCSSSTAVTIHVQQDVEHIIRLITPKCKEQLSAGEIRLLAERISAVITSIIGAARPRPNPWTAEAVKSASPAADGNAKSESDGEGSEHRPPRMPVLPKSLRNEVRLIRKMMVSEALQKKMHLTRWTKKKREKNLP